MAGGGKASISIIFFTLKIMFVAMAASTSALLFIFIICLQTPIGPAVALDTDIRLEPNYRIVLVKILLLVFVVGPLFISGTLWYLASVGNYEYNIFTDFVASSALFLGYIFLSNGLSAAFGAICIVFGRERNFPPMR